MVRDTLLASEYEKNGRYKEAAELYLKFAGKKYKEAGKNRREEGDYVNYIWAAEGYKAAAFCFKKLGDLAKVKENLKKVADSYEKSIISFALFQDTYEAPGIEFHTNWLRKRIADVYSELNEKERAKKLYQGVINFLDIKLRVNERKAATNKLFYGDAGLYCEMLAMVYQKLGEYEKALEYCNKAEEYLGKSEQGALIQTHESDYDYFANDFVEELVVERLENGVSYAEENPEIFGKLEDFKTRINLRRRLINREKEKSHS